MKFRINWPTQQLEDTIIQSDYKRLFDASYLFSAYLGPKLKTSEGLDCTFATNYLGHFLLTKTILDGIKDSNSSIRIVTLLSDSITKSKINFDDIMFEAGETSYDIYKVCTITFVNTL